MSIESKLIEVPVDKEGSCFVVGPDEKPILDVAPSAFVDTVEANVCFHGASPEMIQAAKKQVEEFAFTPGAVQAFVRRYDELRAARDNS